MLVDLQQKKMTGGKNRSKKTRKTVGASRPTREEGNRMENPK